MNIASLAEDTNEFTGSEIEAVVVEAMYIAFDKGGDLDEASLQDAIKATVPLSKTMSAQVRDLREWAKTRTRPCSKQQPLKAASTARRLN